MKNKLSLSLNSIASFLMSICVLWCLSSSFKIKANSIVVFISVVIFTSLFSILSVYASSKKQLRICLTVISFAFLVMTFLSLETLINQTNYIVNCILSPYSKSFPVPTGVVFCDYIDNNASILFVVLGFLLSFVNTISLVRIKRLLPCTILCVLCLIPCFMLVINPPDIIPITVFITILISLYITAFYRKVNFKIHGALFIPIACFVLIFTIITYNLIPVENYKRFKWQDNLLDTVENLRSFDTSHNSPYGESIEEIYKLEEIGPFEQKGIKKFKVNTENSGTLYLKGIAYANYNDNEWSVLSDEQMKSFPENFDAYNITKSGMTQTVNIVAENKSDIIYTAYDLNTISVDFTPVYDVMIKNDTQAQAYDLKCYTDFHSYKLDTPDYDKYVQEVYTQLPESTKEKMLEIAKENGLDQTLNSSTPEMVKSFISDIGYYSLNTEKMPEDKDFPVWFLNEAESGYCVHYATATAVMLRALGIPARYVTGYCVNSVNFNWTEVTSDNAHAWVEYYDQEKGWVVLEPTPSAFLDVSAHREDSETVVSTSPETTAPLPTDTVPAETIPTEPTTIETTSNTNNGGFTAPVKVTTNIYLFIFIIGLIFLVLVALTVRYHICKNTIKKRFYKGKNNTKVIYIYRYIEKIKKFSRNVTPDKIDEIANKAKFSNHRINNEEIEIMLSFAKEERTEIFHNCNKLKSLYYKFIVVI